MKRNVNKLRINQAMQIIKRFHSNRILNIQIQQIQQIFCLKETMNLRNILKLTLKEI